METQIATTIEQSKRLLDAGLNPGSADMHYWSSAFEYKDGFWSPQESGSTIRLVAERPSKEMDIPAWSLSRLIDILQGCDFTQITSKEIIEAHVNAIIFLIPAGFIADEYLKPKNL